MFKKKTPEKADFELQIRQKEKKTRQTFESTHSQHQELLPHMKCKCGKLYCQTLKAMYCFSFKAKIMTEERT